MENEDYGKLMHIIPMVLRAYEEERDIFPDGEIPWIPLIDAETDISRLLNADEVVLPYPEVTVFIDYPLSSPVSFELCSEEGFTRVSLVRTISELYQRIYREEEDSAQTKTIPLQDRSKVLNRNVTDGKYGIGYHDLDDLDLSFIEVVKTEKGDIHLHLGIES
ncbi:hypothetical protein [Gorillibacterium sp. sgz5001074]|uniref:hypothetical protein n=1 Tax=Gorillibacterium sp. sgz5001074 TaxID=3446695 RepID=UPI003F672588